MKSVLRAAKDFTDFFFFKETRNKSKKYDNIAAIAL